jgi:hypothetical protein
MQNGHKRTVLVDGHVHIYDCFDLPGLFDAAYRNFSHAAQSSGAAAQFTGILMLTESKSDDWYQKQNIDTRRAGPWNIHPVDGNCALQAVRDSGEQLLIVAGRQIVTAEGLELLALATDRQFDDGLSLVKALQAVRAHDAIPVIPWAVGKWLGRRGRVLAKVIEDESDNGLFLGDNGGRPSFWKYSSHFMQARQAGLRILPGSDPLPFVAEASRVGSFGFSIGGEVSADQPVADLKKLLRDSSIEVHAYGNLEGTMRFVSNQIRLRL